MKNSNGPEDFAVEVSGLTKKFGDFTAVDDISFRVRRGEIFGFLGPNGAGKSTTIRILCGIIEPTSGEGLVDGLSILHEQTKIKAITGYMSQKFSLYEDLTPFENLEFYGGVYGLGAKKRKERVEWALEMSDLKSRRDDLTSDLPVGYKQRLALGASLLHEPSILFLDEPTAGVDVELRQGMWDVVRSLRASGVTIILTTHYIEEAEEMADRVGVINKGELVLVENKSELMHKLGKKQLTLQLHEPLEAVPDGLASYNLALGADGHELVFTYDTQSERTGITALLGDLGENGIKFKDLQTTQSSLEEIFVSLVKRRA